MQALEFQSFDGPEALKLADVPDPNREHPVLAGPGVLIDVHAGGVSFADVLVTKGRYEMRPKPPFVPGYEAAGTVRAAPPNGGLRRDDRVAACTMDGFAQLAVAPAWATFGLRHRLDYAEGDGLVLHDLHPCFAVQRRRGPREGENVCLLVGRGELHGNVLRIALPLSLTQEEAVEGFEIWRPPSGRHPSRGGRRQMCRTVSRNGFVITATDEIAADVHLDGDKVAAEAEAESGLADTWADGAERVIDAGGPAASVST